MSGTLADVHPPSLPPDYRSRRPRAPARPPVRVAPSPLEAAGPTFPKSFVRDSEADLTTWGKSAPLGEKMVLVGRVLDDAGRPVRRSLVEVWQANASGKYPHPVDDHDAPMDPNFLGKGEVLTDDEGRYRVVTIKPGAYPWQNHAFAWRPAHIHLSLFGNAYAQRLITQMFFPGDPLLAIDAIFDTWQADASGKLPAGGEGTRPFGYGRVSTGADGGYAIDTVMPGSFRGPGGETYAPQISVTIFARGLLKAVQTRVFLAPLDAIKDDPLARAIGDPDRLRTLIAARDPGAPNVYRWDVRLRGAGEAVFIEF